MADGQHAGTGGRQHVQHLKLGRILPVAARHADVAENELGEEGQVEADEHEQRRKFCPAFRIHAAADLRPPEMHASEIPHQDTTYHDVVEVGDHKVGICDVNVDAEGG